MKFFREQCKFSFPNAIIVNSEEPEFSIGKGLAYSGIIDERLREFREEVKDFINSGVVEKNVKEDIYSLVYPMVEKITEFVINTSILPNISLWKKGQINTIEEMNGIISQKVREILEPGEIKSLLEESIIGWSVKLCDKLQVPIDEICDRYMIPKEEMNLLAVDIKTDFHNIDFSIKNLQGENIINGIVSLIVGVLIGMLCGGSGTALIATGPLGFLGGAIIGILAGMVGFNRSKHLFIKKSVPVLLRKLVRKDMFLSDKTREKLNKAIFDELEKNGNSFVEELSHNISRELNQKLEKLAQDVEILIF